MRFIIANSVKTILEIISTLGKIVMYLNFLLRIIIQQRIHMSNMCVKLCYCMIALQNKSPNLVYINVDSVLWYVIFKH